MDTTDFISFVADAVGNYLLTQPCVDPHGVLRIRPSSVGPFSRPDFVYKVTKRGFILPTTLVVQM